VNFQTGANHPGGVASNDMCTVCHRPDGTGQLPGSLLFEASIAEAHRNPAKVAGALYALNIISVTNTAAGQFPVVTYEVTDPANNNARYNILDNSDPVWANSSVAILLGWNNADHHNEGNGSNSTPASAVSLNGRAASSGNNAAPAANPDGSFTVTSLRAIPAGVSGSGVAGLTARAGADFDGNGSYTDRVPIKSVVKYFAITDATPVARRSVVDIANCNQCHDQLTLHGSIRTDEPQICVICHNANNTDIARRPADPMAALDGKQEESIDFKTMIHGIHGAEFSESGIVIYGFGNTPNDFGGVVFPGILSNCSTCHKANTFTVPLAGNVLATTIDSNVVTNHTDDINITPTAAVCSSCHDSTLAQTHMEQNGAMFNMSGDPGMYGETCAVCHSDGRVADVSVVHDVQ
jgi:OmcA/MtrC family decaheme c-type cytochrome